MLRFHLAAKIGGWLSILILFLSCAKTGPPPGMFGKKDIYPPEFESLSVPDSTHVILEFNEALDAESVRNIRNYVIVDTQNTEDTLPVDDAIFGRNKNEVIIHTQTMKVGVTYLISVYNVKDVAGNPIGRKNQHKFSAVKRLDVEKPSLLRTSPASGQKDVSLSVCPLLSFNDVMDYESVVAAITLEDDAQQTVPGRLVGTGHAFHFIPDHPLLTETVYILKVDTTAKDEAGNNLYEEAEIRFKTIVDSDIASVSGKVLDQTKAKATDLKVYLTGSERVDDPDAPWYAISPVQDDLTFSMTGISPVLPKDGNYYLWVVGKLPPETPVDIAAYGCMGVIDKPSALGSLAPGSTQHDLEMTIAMRDKRGPIVKDLVAEPDPYTVGDGLRALCTAEQIGEADATIKAGEVFVGRVGSDGTGQALSPLHGVLGEGKTLRMGGDFLSAFKGIHQEKVPIYFHAQNSDGYWGKIENLTLSRKQPPQGDLFITGVVIFGAEPVENAVLRLYSYDGKTEKLVLMSNADKKGRFRLGPLAPDTYHLFTYKDEKENNLDDDSDPCTYWTDDSGNHDLIVSNTSRDVKLDLGHRPVLRSPMARLYVFVEGKDTGNHGKLYLSVETSDADYDITSVQAISPDGTPIALGDDGKDGDKLADDGIYARILDLAPDQIPSPGITWNYRIRVDDKRGNTVIIGPEDFPSLSATSVVPVQDFVVVAGKDGLKISWKDAASPPPGGYLLFIMPADREAHFDGPGTGELFTNFPMPYHDITEVTLSLDQLGNYWSVPRGSRMLAILMALASDADPAYSDKAIVKLYFLKP